MIYRRCHRETDKKGRDAERAGPLPQMVAEKLEG